MPRTLTHPSLSPELRELHLAAIRKHPQDTTTIKDKNGQTILSSTIANTPVIIKTYQIRTLKNKLAALLHRFRAERAFNAAIAFQKHHIPTPQPYLATFIGSPIPHTAHTTTALYNGLELPTHITHITQNPQHTDQVITSIAQTIQKMAQAKISHGDLHVRNILVDPQANISIIDLDGARIHTFNTRHRKRYTRDRLRLITSAQREISEHFAQLLSAAIPPTP